MQVSTPEIFAGNQTTHQLWQLSKSQTGACLFVFSSVVLQGKKGVVIS